MEYPTKYLIECPENGLKKKDNQEEPKIWKFAT